MFVDSFLSMSLSMFERTVWTGPLIPCIELFSPGVRPLSRKRSSFSPLVATGADAPGCVSAGNIDSDGFLWQRIMGDSSLRSFEVNVD